ncbi:MAG: hypothetical protein CM1200mP20_15370 [Pseudomonadota bacterium]|nr:MAG: hypothetical protein CM1200mP20_15370 [Pseudomonadota bacterium]
MAGELQRRWQDRDFQPAVLALQFESGQEARLIWITEAEGKTLPMEIARQDWLGKINGGCIGDRHRLDRDLIFLHLAGS